MKLRKLLIPFTIIASLGAVLMTGCHRHHHDPEERADWLVHKVSKKLDLSDEQKLKLVAVRTELMQHYDKHRQDKSQMMDVLLSEVKKPQMDENVLMEMVNQHKTRVDEVAPAVISKLIDFHRSLNDEQKQELVQKLQKVAKYRQHHEH